MTLVRDRVTLDAALETPGWMTPDELAWLAQQAQTCARIIEVGCWKGRSTLALADNTDGVVYAVDHWQGTLGDREHARQLAWIGADGLYDAFVSYMNGRIETGRVVPIRLSSAEAASAFAPQSIDFVFIDGSHHYDDVRRDLELYRPLIKPGGILAGHDYANPQHTGVTRAVDTVLGPVHRAGLSIWWVHV